MEPSEQSPGVSVVIPFSDHEDSIGRLCTRIDSLLTTAEVPYKMFAIDENSRDNSPVVLTLVRAQLPGLQVISADGFLEGAKTGARLATAPAVLFVSPTASPRSVARIPQLLLQFERSLLDVLTIAGEIIFVRRHRLAGWLGRITGPGISFSLGLAKHATKRDLHVIVETAPFDRAVSEPGNPRPHRFLTTRPFARS